MLEKVMTALRAANERREDDTPRSEAAKKQAGIARKAVEDVESMSPAAAGFQAACEKARKAVDDIPGNAGQEMEALSLHERLDEL